MIIEIANNKININLIHSIKNLDSYKCDGEALCEITSHVGMMPIPRIMPYKENEFYKLYNVDSKIMQVQYENGEILGQIIYEDKKVSIYLNKNTSQVEYILSQYAIDYLICKYFGGILFHASSIIYDDIAIAFTAPSGTGKSTARAMWEGHGAVCINDDKCILKMEGGHLFVYPSPWSGKHRKDTNVSHELNAIVCLGRGNNTFDDVTSTQKFKKILSQIDLPYEYNKDIWNEIVDNIMKTNIYVYNLNMSDEAFKVLKERIADDYAN